jgi:hypothetical protein
MELKSIKFAFLNTTYTDFPCIDYLLCELSMYVIFLFSSVAGFTETL